MTEEHDASPGQEKRRIANQLLTTRRENERSNGKGAASIPAAPSFA
jgi:hypothetical protein